MHVLISYSRENKKYAEQISNHIQLADFEVWWDIDSLEPGDIWSEELDKAIRESFALIVVLTPQAISSHWVTYEWTYASALEIPVIPLMIEEVSIQSVHKKLEKFQILPAINLDPLSMDRLTKKLRSLEDIFSTVRNVANRDELGKAIEQLTHKAKINRGLLNSLLEVIWKV